MVEHRSTPASPGWARVGNGIPASRRRTRRDTAVGSGVNSAGTHADYAGRVSEPEPPEAAHSATSGSSTESAVDRYTERLWVPWWWWPAAAVVTAVAGYEIQLSAHRASWSFIGYIGVGALCVLMLWSLGRPTVRVTADGELRAGKARLPRSVIARGASVPASAKSAALGRQLDPAAFLMHHAWVKTMVLLVLDDPDDPTPYWLVSTRHPDEVLAALGVADATAGAGD